MTATAQDQPRPVERRRGFLRHVGDGPALSTFGPNWFAAVMGTGIVANAAATLPAAVPGLLAFARVVWVLDVVLLVLVLAATATHWLHHPSAARRHLDDPVMGHFYGAPAMALMTVGAGGLLVGTPLIGVTAAVTADVVLWTAGTSLGVWTTVAVTARMRAANAYAPDAAFGGWLMPIVPLMVSAATGPLLVPHLPAGLPRVMLEAACGLFFLLALALSARMTVPIVRRVARGPAIAPAAAPTVFIVLGFLGQSVTAAHTISEPSGHPALRVVAVVYGLPVWCLAIGWLVVAMVVVARKARRGLPFSLTWWSFTFPVGTVVTGTSALAATTGSDAFAVAAVALYALLVTAWAVVIVLTAGHTWTGRLLTPA